MMKVFTSKNGLIYEGDSILSASFADRLAEVNGFVYAERLVDAYAGKDFKTDDTGRILEISESIA